MEKLAFTFDGGAPADGARSPRIVGVVASGNLEVLIEPLASLPACTIEVNTAVHGFAATWQAVMDDFFARHPVGGVRISINDAGATPAIVALRLDQAIEAYLRAAPA
jgi:malonate decarboxylase delta subunit